MSFLPVNSVRNHLRFVKMYNEWCLSKNSSETNSSSPISELQKSVQDNRKSMKIGSIITKLKTGKKLAPAELEYLRVNPPDLYIKAVKISNEREAYEAALKKCKNKEDVERLHNQKRMQLKLELHCSDADETEMRMGQFHAAMRIYAIR
ncbi:MAG: hypothetical protein PHE79_06170 [Eubacteriales bacterium]|nr:hypothetical protein [Eubacteriales bacterium]